MGLFDALRGRGGPAERQRPLSEDELALERYRYMLRTAPPDQIERAHEEAFARLSPDQRAQLLRELSAEVPPEERAPTDDPAALARMATRAEVRRPGTVERALGGVPMGGGFGGFGGFGGMLGGTLLGGLVGSFLGTAIAQQFFDGDGAHFGDGGAEAGYDGAAEPEMVGYDGGFADHDAGGDLGDLGSDLGDVGGDMI